MTDSQWNTVCAPFQPGALLKDDAYRVVRTDDKRIVVERLATGSIVTVTRAMIAKTLARLEAGEFIAKRTISYTVAIETVVVAALGDRIKEGTRGKTRGYALASLALFLTPFLEILSD